MNMGHCNDTQVCAPTYSAGKNASGTRPQSRFYSCSSVQSNTGFKKPRFSDGRSNPRIPLPFNRAKFPIPYKSEMCLQFQRGKCYYGGYCHYSHSNADAKKPGFSTADMKLKECYWFSSGVCCPYGDDCQFLHKCDQKVRRDVGLYRDGYAMVASGGSDGSGIHRNERRSRRAGEVFDKLVSRKTKLCIKWQRFGSCPRGAKCIYAHGRKELKGLGSFSEMEYGHTSRLKLSSEPRPATSCEIGTKTAKELQPKGKRCFMKWDIEKISQIYADWIDNGQNIHVPVGKVES